MGRAFIGCGVTRLHDYRKQRSMAREIDVFGPPGCGKSTYVARQVEVAAEKHGKGAVFVASFTKAAAAELAGRKMTIDKGMVGTLHAHCYRALERPPIAETKAAAWNEKHPDMALSSAGAVDVDDPLAEPLTTENGAAGGDEAMAVCQVLRAQMVPVEQWPLLAKRFHEAWTKWKHAEGLIDFTDMIERCLEEVPTAPGDPRVAFFDEAQDFTPLELALVRRWCTETESFVLVGDDDQCIYSFKGATPDAFLEGQKNGAFSKVLSQSYRVPRAVHEFATRISAQISRRQPKEYAPRDFGGSVERSDASWKRPEWLVDEIERHTSAGKKCMILASCSYFLRPIIAVLRKEAIPYHNPWRRKRGDWNPLLRGYAKKDGTATHSALDRLMAFLVTDPTTPGPPREEWTWGEIVQWTKPLESDGVFRKGFKKAAAQKDQAAFADVFDLGDWMQPEAMARAEAHDLDWFYANLLGSEMPKYEFPVSIARKRGKQALRAEPLVSIGTIHSVKGAEADVVFLVPDLSRRGYEQWMFSGKGGTDSTLRLFYVGATRARESLVLCSPGTKWHFEWAA